MSLNSTPSSERIYIGIFGKRNAGKSSVINAITGQNSAIVSDIKGTTTDPVYKSMELLPLGPVIIIDTPGIDDEGELGNLRVEKSNEVLNKTDIAILVIDGTIGKSIEDEELINKFENKNIPYIVVMNKEDLIEDDEIKDNDIKAFWVSTKTNKNIYELKELIAKQINCQEPIKRLVADLLSPSDFVVLVVPIDKSAPKGRLILPQQQTVRDILEADAISIVVKDSELKSTLESLVKKPKLIITDSQVFAKVSADAPEDIMLTSFSILFSRYKGNLKEAIKGTYTLDSLNDGDTVLISEGCTHHRQCEDIGTVKLPKLILNHTKKNINFEFTSGAEFPTDLTKYKLVVHCGGCMLNEREMKHRIKCTQNQCIPITNYGILMAYIQGILKRCIEIFNIDKI
ncbi:[FeFe] hydrogenase H-cluster maturation GTPase HydF [Sedimentibacter sp.]|uniref:[FeFe] hydrogenase H-cluster maturation GTPase HydF n=1 Tax=Sedimentibacter sp. TaxID=1960295 RepID=UPI0028A817F9|nr:[FeFe] hydrogenase H-cluster maturation GTPase HydF [Sedimentibacter sp.]